MMKITLKYYWLSQVFVSSQSSHRIVHAIYLLLFFKDNIIKSGIDCLPAKVDSFLINTATTVKNKNEK